MADAEDTTDRIWCCVHARGETGRLGSWVPYSRRDACAVIAEQASGRVRERVFVAENGEDAGCAG